MIQPAINVLHKTQIGPLSPCSGSINHATFGPLCTYLRQTQGNTVVGDYINTMKTTFNFNFDLYQAVTQQKHRSQDKLLIKKGSFN